MDCLRKNLEHSIEDIDEKGVVSIYVNAFGNTDSDGDISVKGSFKKTITENFRRIKHFVNHDDQTFPIGLPIEMKEDDFGLLVRSKLNLEKQLPKDVYSDYKFFKEHDRTLEHSIGFRIIQRDQNIKAMITEYQLWEYSTLGNWGANQNTPLVDIKSLKNPDQLILKISELTDMYNRNYSDGRLIEIEKALKSLGTIEPGSLRDTTLQEEPIKVEPIELIKLLKKSFQEN
jgi:HK97 family phage prohead protease